MSYQTTDPITWPCSECGQDFDTHTVNKTTCGPACARARKTRLQRERRDASAAQRGKEAAAWYEEQRKRYG
jgi:hypothetical protein